MKNRAKIAVAAPIIHLADPIYNAELCTECAMAADKAGADIIVFPELALCGATLGDLYFQEVLLEECERALIKYVTDTKELEVMSFVGVPLCSGGHIYNAVVCVSEGEIIGATVSGIPSRHFTPLVSGEIDVTVGEYTFTASRSFIYTDEDISADIFVKVGDDTAFSSDGVNIILNPKATAEYVGLKEERRQYANAVSSALRAAFVIAGAGEGESGTDGIYAGARVVSSYGKTVAEAELFDSSILYADIDLTKRFAKSDVKLSEPRITRYPFVPDDEKTRKEHCALALEIQSRALAKRLERAYAKCAVIGVSGGLDSTLAVLVASRAVKLAGLDTKSVIAITMPCFGTTERTKNNALGLAEELGCSVRTIDIKKSVEQHFEDISHDKNNYDVVYENAQARERTQILMDIANAEGGLVVGTGDLSELALGFATYNGDHMSMYCVNASVPKTFMRAVIAYAADSAMEEGRDRLSKILRDVIETPVSPELLPLEDGENKQHTESIIGPYDFHDFFLYHTVKYGTAPEKICELAVPLFPDLARDEIYGYADVFVRRFFSQQFKRSCLPDAPRVTEITLSPRGAWQMPSDVSSRIWRSRIGK